MKKLAAHLSIFMLILAAFLHAPAAFAVGAITLTPSSSSITEGQSQIIGIHLGSNPGSTVIFTMTSSNPDSVSISPSSITYLASEWAQTKNFTVSVPQNGTYGDTRNVIIMAKASSASQEYNGIAGGANVHVTDTTPEPGVSDPQDPPDTEDPADDDPDPQSTPETSNTTDPVNANSEQSEAVTTQTYKQLNEQDLASPDDITFTQAIGSPSASLKWLKDGLLPSTASAQHRAKAYTIFLMFMTLGIGLVIYYERKHWWLRQENKVLRWQYRHPQPKRPRKRPVKKKRQ